VQSYGITPVYVVVDTFLSACRNFSDIARVPPLWAFLLTCVLPTAVLRPVELSHGRHLWICADCRIRRSGVQPFAIPRLQKFVLLDFHFPAVAVVPDSGLRRCFSDAVPFVRQTNVSTVRRTSRVIGSTTNCR
jgi:hypothetical protein